MLQESGQHPWEEDEVPHGQSGGDQDSGGRHRVHVPILTDTLPPCCAHRRPALLLGAEVLVARWM